MNIDNENTFDQLNSLVGLVVSRLWQGFGSTLFLELGKLKIIKYNSGKRGERTSQQGEVTIQIDWYWRFENYQKIICGSDEYRSVIENYINTIVGSTVLEIKKYGSPPELSILLSNKIRLNSFAPISGDPQWSVRLQDGRWLFCANGEVTDDFSCKDESFDLADDEAELSAKIKEAAVRWGVPKFHPVKGCCKECSYLINIEAGFEFSDYGVCYYPMGPFDGKVVNKRSGCPKFVHEDFS